MTHTLFKSVVALSMMVLLLQTVSGQRGTHVTKRVSFRTGTNSTVIKGTAQWGTRYVYLLRARAGQTLTVRLEGVPVMRILPPGTRNYEALPGADIVKDWSGKLPKSGDYTIDVGHTDDRYSGAPYTLQIKVE